MTAHPESPIRDVLSPEFLAQFDHAGRIQAAFFPSGPDPRVDLIVSHVDSTADVAAARLVINDMLIETVKGDVPVLVQWPGPGTGVRLSLMPEVEGETSGFWVSGSAWDVMRAIQSASSRAVQGDRIRASFVLGSRQITYEIRSRVVPHPLALRDLTQFTCPQGLE
jgi:type VI secretion system protein ImpL